MIVYPDLVKLYGLAAEMMSCNSDKIRMQSWPEDAQGQGGTTGGTKGVPRQIFKFTHSDTCSDTCRDTQSDTCSETCNNRERQTYSLTLTVPPMVDPVGEQCSADLYNLPSDVPKVDPRVDPVREQCSADLYNLPSDVPEGTTHIDMDNDSSSRFMKLIGDDWYFNSDSMGWVYLSPHQIEPDFQCVKVEDYYVGYNT